MAFCDEKFCDVCNAETWHTNNVCGLCLERRLTTASNKHFAELDKMTMEERVRRIEKWIYRQTHEVSNLLDI